MPGDSHPQKDPAAGVGQAVQEADPSHTAAGGETSVPQRLVALLPGKIHS